MNDGEKGVTVSNVEKENIAPFLTILVMKKNSSSDFLKIHSDVIEKISNNSKDEILLGEHKEEKYDEALGLIYTTYNVFSTPSWLIGLSDKDLERNVAVSIYRGEYIAFYFSQKGTMDQVREIIEHH